MQNEEIMFFLKTEAEDVGKFIKLLSKFSNHSNWDESLLDDLIQIYNNIEFPYYTTATSEDTHYVKVWDDLEKDTYAHYHNEILETDKNLELYYSVYPRCCYCLAVMFLEKNNLENAEIALNTGLQLEENHPMLIMETANLFIKKAVFENEKQHYLTAIDFFTKAINSRPYNLSKLKASAQRSIGFCHIELGNYDAAVKAYQASIKFEWSQKAINELIIIKELKKGTIKTPTPTGWSIGGTKLE